MASMTFLFISVILVVSALPNSEICGCSQSNTCSRSCKDLFKVNEGGFKFFEQQFNKTLECLKLYLRTDNPDKLMALDPFRVNRTFPFKIELPHYILSTDLELSDFVIYGLTDVDAVLLNLSPLLELEANFRFNKIQVHAYYEGEWRLLDIMRIDGRGTFDMEMKNLNIKTITQYQLTPRLINDLSVTASVRKLNITMTGVWLDEEFSKVYSAWITKYVYLIINTYQKEIGAFITPYIEKQLDVYMGHLNFLDFLGMITSSNCNC